GGLRGRGGPPNSPLGGAEDRVGGGRRPKTTSPGCWGAAAVVHLAWLFQPTHEPLVTWRANVEGSVRLFRAAADAGVAALVYASSVGDYSPGPKDPGQAVGGPRLVNLAAASGLQLQAGGCGRRRRSSTSPTNCRSWTRGERRRNSAGSPHRRAGRHHRAPRRPVRQCRDGHTAARSPRRRTAPGAANRRGPDSLTGSTADPDRALLSDEDLEAASREGDSRSERLAPGCALPRLLSVHGPVGPFEEIGEAAFLARWAMGGPDAHRQRIGNRRRRLLDAGADAVLEAVHLLGFGEENGELVTAQAAHDVRLPAGGLQRVGHQLQRPVAFGVAVGVVDRLQMIQVEEQRDDRPARPGRLSDRLLPQKNEGPAVVEARELVDQGQLPELLLLLAAD